MAKAIIIEEIGAPEVLQIKKIKEQELKEGEARVRQTVLGLNFLDILYRRGVKKSSLPQTLGFEACGVVEEVKGDVGNLKPGDRVAYATAPMGAYTEVRNIHYKYLVRVPDEITDEQAAAVLFKGMTAHCLLRRTSFISKGMTIVVHAAAGGVGMLMCQMASHFGATVIGTVGSEEKAKVAKHAGCKHVINYTKENFAERVLEITKGQGVNAVYDSIGKDTLNDSLKALMHFGLLVSFGQSSGKAAPVNIHALSKKSLFVTSPSLFTYKQHRYEMVLTAGEVFEMLKKGIIQDNINYKYKFEEIAQAHSDLENRATVGSNIILV